MIRAENNENFSGPLYDSSLSLIPTPNEELEGELEGNFVFEHGIYS